MQDALEDARRDRVPELSNADSRREDEANLPAADFLVQFHGREELALPGGSELYAGGQPRALKEKLDAQRL